MNSAKTFCEVPQKLLSPPLSFLPSPLLLGPCRERTHQGDGKPSPQEKTGMHTRNVNVRTAAQESSRKMGENTVNTAAMLGDLPPMPGLALRIKWGMARVMLAIDQAKAEDEMTDAQIEAQFEGYHDFSAGENTPPHMITDVPELASAWKDGWHTAASFAETAACSECQNDSGDPCSIHG
nr:hypothetical protein [Leclercia adecarboxylata]